METKMASRSTCASSRPRSASSAASARRVGVHAVGGRVVAVLILLALPGIMVRRLRVVQDNAHRLAQGLPLQPMLAGSDEIATLSQELFHAARLLGDRDRVDPGPEPLGRAARRRDPQPRAVARRHLRVRAPRRPPASWRSPGPRLYGAT